MESGGRGGTAPPTSLRSQGPEPCASAVPPLSHRCVKGFSRLEGRIQAVSRRCEPRCWCSRCARIRCFGCESLLRVAGDVTLRGFLAHHTYLRTVRQVTLDLAADVLPSVCRIEPGIPMRDQAA